MSISFDSGDQALQAPNVPANYLPVALDAIQTRHSVSLSSEDAPFRVMIQSTPGLPPLSVPFRALQNPENFVGEVVERNGEAVDINGIAGSFLGPHSSTADFEEPPMTTSTNKLRAANTIVAIVDTGIAFWNQRFSDSGVPMFHRMGYLAFNSEERTPGLQVLDHEGIRTHCNTAQTRGGERAVLDALKASFPECVYNHGQSVTSFSHGTAMADLALQGKFDGAVGIELPASVLLDPTGGTLQAVLPHALLSAAELARQAHLEMGTGGDLQVLVLLSYGFTGGPHDNTHAANKAILSVLNKPAGDEVLRVFLPLGNQLQDRLHARVGISESVDNAPLHWELQHDDGSSNTVEIHAQGERFPVLQLTAPDGGVARLAPEPGTVYRLWRSGEVIGAAWMPTANGSKPMLRLCLAPTRKQRTSLNTAPAGTWKLGFPQDNKGLSQQELDLWILRDDQPTLPQIRPPYRQSHFTDPAYPIKTRTGSYHIDDQQPPVTPIRRRGTASVLAAASNSNIVSVAAKEQNGPLREHHAWYCGLPYDGITQDQKSEVVDQVFPGNGTSCLGNGSKRKFRVSGSSVAAALCLARELQSDVS